MWWDLKSCLICWLVLYFFFLPPTSHYILLTSLVRCIVVVYTSFPPLLRYILRFIRLKIISEHMKDTRLNNTPFVSHLSQFCMRRYSYNSHLILLLLSGCHCHLCQCHVDIYLTHGNSFDCLFEVSRAQLNIFLISVYFLIERVFKHNIASFAPLFFQKQNYCHGVCICNFCHILTYWLISSVLCL